LKPIFFLLKCENLIFKTFLNFKSFFRIEGVFQTVIAFVGFISNVTFCYILTRRRMLNCFNLLLVSLSAYDTTYLLGSILESIRKYFESLQTDIHVLLFPHFLYPLQQVWIFPYAIFSVYWKVKNLWKSFKSKKWVLALSEGDFPQQSFPDFRIFSLSLILKSWPTGPNPAGYKQYRTQWSRFSIRTEVHEAHMKHLWVMFEIQKTFLKK